MSISKNFQNLNFFGCFFKKIHFDLFFNFNKNGLKQFILIIKLLKKYSYLSNLFICKNLFFINKMGIAEFKFIPL